MLPVVPNEILNNEPGLSDWCILHGFRGSLSMGLFVPKNDPDSIDDVDTMAICVPPPSYYLGIDEYYRRGTKEVKIDEWDIVVYEARKMIGLLMEGNPNVLSLLWLADKYYIKKTYAGQMLIEQRNLFVGKHAYHSFIGYAHGQMHRMTHYSGREPTEIIELAQLFDKNGEVSIVEDVAKEGKPELPMFSLNIYIQGVPRNLVQYLYDEFGGVAGPQYRDGDDWSWLTAGQQASKFLKMILPHLYVKTQHAEAGIEFYNFVLNRKKNRPFTGEDIGKIEAIRDILRTDYLAEIKEADKVQLPYTNAYMGAKRRQLVEKYGYDAKNASHLIRLLRMGIEFLNEGVIYVERTHDKDELLEIKQGKWELKRVKELADDLFEQAKIAYDASKLPDSPDKGEISDLCTKVVQTALLERGDI